MTVLYWDASALLSVLIRDVHTEEALRHARTSNCSLVSTLATAETLAVLRRMRHDALLTHAAHRAALDAFDAGPWRQLNLQPAWPTLGELADRYVLKGADLWHLATVKTLQEELPEVKLLTFDRRLQAAARRERLTP